MQYRRWYVPGGTYFFTVNLLERGGNDLLVRRVSDLREVVAEVRAMYPFRVDACVVLPDHLHCVWTLPPGDADFSRRLRLIKGRFSRRVPLAEWISPTRRARGERAVWQRRFWEHCVRDERDYRFHVDYVHLNPLKHGWVQAVRDWPFSTFHREVVRGVYPSDWAG